MPLENLSHSLDRMVANASDCRHEEIDGKVRAFPERPIEGDWPYLWIDATTYLKVRRGGLIVSVAVIIAVGVNADGRREALGTEVGTSEATIARYVHLTFFPC